MRHLSQLIGCIEVDDFEIVWAEGYGSLRAGGGVGVDGGTLFHAGSVVKPVSIAGGLWTTSSDLARFAIEIMKEYRGTSDRLLSHEMAQEMLVPQISISGNPIADAMAFGFERSGSGPEFAIVHTGGTWGSTAVLLACLKRVRAPSS